MSTELMAKYLKAAREVADHMVLRPDGIVLAAHPMLVETDREKHVVQRILDFYSRQPLDLADYFEAAWRYKNRAMLGQPRSTLNGIAAEMKVSPKYVPMVWGLLTNAKEVGPGAKLQAMWATLPVPHGNQSALARDGCVSMRDFVVAFMWKNRLVAASHREFDPDALRVEGEPPPPPDLVVTKVPMFGQGEVTALKVAVAAYIKERQQDPDLMVPAGQRARDEAAFARFSSVFPDKFYLRERGRFYPAEIESDKGRAG